MAPLLSFPLQSPPPPERLATLKVFGVHVLCPARVCAKKRYFIRHGMKAFERLCCGRLLVGRECVFV